MNIGNTLYFRADDGTHGYELWRSDGTSSGTAMVTDVNPDGASWRPNYLFRSGELINMEETFYFVADDGVHGAELWRSDGSAEGTWMIDDIEPGSYGSSPSELTVHLGTLYFVARYKDDDQLWRSDGTKAGTEMVKDIHPGPPGPEPHELVSAGDYLYFVADDGEHGEELWRSDGTENGTAMVKDIGGARWSQPRRLTVVGERLFFAATDGVHGVELWRSDGTEAGTYMVRDITPTDKDVRDDRAWAGPNDLMSFGRQLYFVSNDATHGHELWRSDGTRRGTSLFADLEPGRVGSEPSRLASFGRALYFTASLGSETLLWRTDGTQSGTRAIWTLGGIKNIPPSPLMKVDRLVYFFGFWRGHGYELSRTDGTRGGTRMVEDINPGPSPSGIRWLTNVGGVLYFAADDGRRGRELWRLK